MSARRPFMVWDIGPWEYNKTMTQAFFHEELELKQQFLNLARDLYAKSQTIENELAAALLYMNAADYLAEYLVVGLNQMASEALTKYYLGVVSVKPPQLGRFNIGDSLHQLKRFDFPRKNDILEELNAINAARKTIAHQMLKMSGQQFPQIDEAVASLVEHTEALVVVVDEISPGLPPANMLDKFIQQPEAAKDYVEATDNIQPELPKASKKPSKSAKAKKPKA
jgi:hypothetical protein